MQKENITSSSSLGSEPITVVVRCRPLLEGERSANILHLDNNVCQIEHIDGHLKTFTFDACYSEHTTTQDIFKNIGINLVNSVTSGYNGVIFAYGQTSAGKSFTMKGVSDPPSQKGIIPRAFTQIFDKVDLTDNLHFIVRVAYIEIYNEEVRDLLSKDLRKKLEIQESPDRGVQIKDLSWFCCQSVKDCETLLEKGCKNRVVGETLMNCDSSRSHTIFMINVETLTSTLPSANEKFVIRVGKLNLVDLAGSERQCKTDTTGMGFREAVKINLSLSALGNVISTLAVGKARHIPYRDSKLTRLLQDSLGGHAKTVIIACLSRSACNYEQTLSTLRFAHRAKNIKNRPRPNDTANELLRLYIEEIMKLKQKLINIRDISTYEEKDAELQRTKKEAHMLLQQKNEQIAGLLTAIQKIRENQTVTMMLRLTIDDAVKDKGDDPLRLLRSKQRMVVIQKNGERKPINIKLTHQADGKNLGLDEHSVVIANEGFMFPVIYARNLNDEEEVFTKYYVSATLKAFEDKMFEKVLYFTADDKEKDKHHYIIRIYDMPSMTPCLIKKIRKNKNSDISIDFTGIDDEKPVQVVFQIIRPSTEYSSRFIVSHIITNDGVRCTMSLFYKSFDIPQDGEESAAAPEYDLVPFGPIIMEPDVCHTTLNYWNGKIYKLCFLRRSDSPNILPVLSINGDRMRIKLDFENEQENYEIVELRPDGILKVKDKNTSDICDCVLDMSEDVSLKLLTNENETETECPYSFISLMKNDTNHYIMLSNETYEIEKLKILQAQRIRLHNDETSNIYLIDDNKPLNNRFLITDMVEKNNKLIISTKNDEGVFDFQIDRLPSFSDAIMHNIGVNDNSNQLFVRFTNENMSYKILEIILLNPVNYQFRMMEDNGCEKSFHMIPNNESGVFANDGPFTILYGNDEWRIIQFFYDPTKTLNIYCQNELDKSVKNFTVERQQLVIVSYDNERHRFLIKHPTNVVMRVNRLLIGTINKVHKIHFSDQYNYVYEGEIILIDGYLYIHEQSEKPYLMELVLEDNQILQVREIFSVGDRQTIKCVLQQEVKDSGENDENIQRLPNVKEKIFTIFHPIQFIGKDEEGNKFAFSCRLNSKVYRLVDIDWNEGNMVALDEIEKKYSTFKLTNKNFEWQFEEDSSIAYRFYSFVEEKIQEFKIDSIHSRNNFIDIRVKICDHPKWNTINLAYVSYPKKIFIDSNGERFDFGLYHSEIKFLSVISLTHKTLVAIQNEQSLILTLTLLNLNTNGCSLFYDQNGVKYEFCWKFSNDDIFFINQIIDDEIYVILGNGENVKYKLASEIQPLVGEKLNETEKKETKLRLYTQNHQRIFIEKFPYEGYRIYNERLEVMSLNLNYKKLLDPSKLWLHLKLLHCDLRKPLELYLGYPPSYALLDEFCFQDIQPFRKDDSAEIKTKKDIDNFVKNEENLLSSRVITGGSRLHNTELLRRLKKEQELSDAYTKDIERTRKKSEEFFDALAAMNFVPTRKEIKLKTDQLEKEHTKIEAMKEELESDHSENLETFTSLRGMIVEQEKKLKLLSQLLEKVQPIIRKDCNYSDISEIFYLAKWDEPSSTWELPPLELLDDKEEKKNFKK
ncbi:hypothetical protein SNEBB_001975 [Seison nebaliae]|nr:hypothetical protein SNEBB_001975 [Seison nebaliae]